MFFPLNNVIILVINWSGCMNYYELLGVSELSDSSVKFRVTALCVSMEHYGVERKIRKAVKERLDQENIKIPYPQIEVHHGE